MRLSSANKFLNNIISEFNLSSASLCIDRDGFFIWVKNQNGDCKRIILGENDFDKSFEDLIKEIKELIESQGW